MAKSNAEKNTEVELDRLRKIYKAGESWEPVILDAMDGILERSFSAFVTLVEEVTGVAPATPEELQRLTGLSDTFLREENEIDLLSVLNMAKGKKPDYKGRKPSIVLKINSKKGDKITSQAELPMYTDVIKEKSGKKILRLTPENWEIVKAQIEKELGIAPAKKLTRIGMHAVSQFFHNGKTPDLFTGEIENYKLAGLPFSEVSKEAGLGILLTDIQLSVYLGIIGAFSETNYKGHKQEPIMTALNRHGIGREGKQLLKEKESSPYRNISEVPVIRITQAELLKVSGAGRKRSEKTHVIEALQNLANKQFIFYWERLKYDAKGRPVRDKKTNNWKKEGVIEVGTLLRVKNVTDPATEKLLYYEISPSAVHLDQLSNYYLAFPAEWKQEVKEITGKAPSKYTNQFLLWLRVQFAKIDRGNKAQKRYEIRCRWEDIAKALKMPESIYIRNRQRAQKIIQEAYSVALKAGYLDKIETEGTADILYLNQNYYTNPEKGGQSGT